MKRRKKKSAKEHITRDTLLDLLKLGAILTVAFTAPKMLRILKSSREEKPWEPYYPSSVARTTTTLWRKGFVDVKEGKDGFTVTLTDKGKREILQYDLEEMSIPKQEPWDGRWRMVFFDIAAGDPSRHMFRDRLKALGFFPMQESVYVHPYPCRKQIQFLREIYEIPHSVKLASVSWLENDEDLRGFFRLS